jgi:dienelactone hydrolase
MSVVASVLGVLPAGMPTPTYAQARYEMRPIETITLSTQQVLTGDKNGEPATLAGELRIPGPGTDKIPAVILLHGGAGIGPHHERWAQEINSIGVAAFLLDSLSGRGLENAANLSSLSVMVDAYRALDRLAQHPRIDQSRISVMGFSTGAGAAIYSSNERFLKLYGPPNVKFAAHLGLYTPCGITYRDDTKVTGKPMRLFHGLSDDWNAIGPCRAYVARLWKAGVDATLTEFRNATHVYDGFALKQPVKLPARTVRHCQLAEGDGGQIMNTRTNTRWDWDDPCVEKGVTIVYNEEATAATARAVKELLMALSAGVTPKAGEIPTTKPRPTSP